MTANTVTTSLECIDSKNILRIIDKHNENWGGLIAILEDIQAEYGYLPEEALRMVADKTHCSLADLYGLATFYRSFSLKPRGKHLISVCLGTACHVRGAPTIVEEFERQLGISTGKNTPDGQFTLETVNCLGACALGPIVVVDGKVHGCVSPQKVQSILSRYTKKRTTPSRHDLNTTDAANQEIVGTDCNETNSNKTGK